MSLATITDYNIINDELVILKQNSSRWYAQIKTAPELGFKNNRVRFSTKCKIGVPSDEESFNNAIAFAKTEISRNNVLREEGHPLYRLKPTVKQVALKVLKEYEKSETDKSRYISIIKNQIIPLLGNLYMKNFDLNELFEFFENRTGGKSKTQITMVKRAINDIYVYAIRKKMIVQADRPLWTDIKVKTDKFKTRLTFRKTDIEIIDENIDDFINASTSKTCKINRILFKFYISFIKETGTRPGTETTGIKWKHLFESAYENEKRATVFLEKGKMGEQNKTRDIHIDQATFKLLTQLYFKKVPNIETQRFLLKYSSNGFPISKFMEFKKINADKYVFARGCGKIPDFCDTWKQFREFIKTDLTNKTFTLYSFRHHFITKNLYQKTDVNRLAEHVGNSEAMIRKYYAGCISAAASECVVKDLTQENVSITSLINS